MLAALVAVTTHVPAALLVRFPFPVLIWQVPLMGMTKVTPPAPEPPVVVTVTIEPTVVLNVVFEIFNVACFSTWKATDTAEEEMAR